MPSFRKRKAEPSALRVADNAEAIIASRDEEIAALHAQLDTAARAAAELQDDLGRALAALHEKAAEARDLDFRAQRAEGQLQYAAIGLSRLAAPSGMTIARRAELAAVMLEALDVPAAAGEAVAGEPA